MRKSLSPERRYPGFIFINCGYLAELAAQKDASIDEKFVTTQKEGLKDTAALS